MDMIARTPSYLNLTAAPAAAPMPVKPAALALGKPDANDPVQIDKAARDLESVFAKMLISSMRQASFGDSLFPQENATFRDLYDQTLAKKMSAGPGLGLAPVIAKQLSRASVPAAAPSDDFGEPAPMRPLDRSPSATEETTFIDERETALGTYHRPASARTPAWLARGSEAVHSNGHFYLARGTGPAMTASTTLPQESFALATPIATGPRVTDVPAAASAIRTGTPEAFVASIWPQAQAAAEELGVDPKVLVAQAALETGWGRHVVGRGKDGSGGNLFGIKAGGRWSGAAVSANTREVVNGHTVRQHASFRSYDSIKQSFDDYVALLKGNDRYAEALGAGGDRRRFATALHKAGYATDPHYANKLLAIAEGPTLRRALDRLNPATVLAANTASQSTASNLPAMAES